MRIWIIDGLMQKSRYCMTDAKEPQAASKWVAIIEVV